MAILNLDFTGVETQAGFLPPGVYRARVAKVDHVDGRNYPGLKFVFESTESETEGMRSEMFLSLAPQALWKLKLTLESLGAEIPQSKVKINTDNFVGRVGRIEVVNEPWTDAEGNSHDSSKVSKVWKAGGEAAGEATSEEGESPPPSDLTPADEFKGIDFSDDDDLDGVPF